MLSRPGVLLGLFAFVAAQMWGDNDRGSGAVMHELSGLRAVVLLLATFPAEPETVPRLIHVSAQPAESADERARANELIEAGR